MASKQQQADFLEAEVEGTLDVSNKVGSSDKCKLPTKITEDLPTLTSDEISEQTNPEVTLEPLAPDEAPAAGSRLSILGNPDPGSAQDKETEADSTIANDSSVKSMEGKNFSAVISEGKAVIIDIFASDNKQKPLHTQKRAWESFEDDDAMNNSDNSDLLDVSQKSMQANSEDPCAVSLSGEKKLKMAKATTSALEELDSTKMVIAEYKQVAGDANVEGLQESQKKENGCQDLWHNLGSCSHQVGWKKCQVSIRPTTWPPEFDVTAHVQGTMRKLRS